MKAKLRKAGYLWQKKECIKWFCTRVQRKAHVDEKRSKQKPTTLVSVAIYYSSLSHYSNVKSIVAQISDVSTHSDAFDIAITTRSTSMLNVMPDLDLFIVIDTDSGGNADTNVREDEEELTDRNAFRRQ